MCALFIIDSNLDLALATGTDGLRLNPDDLPVKAIRKLLPIDTILGISVDNTDEAVAALVDGADYITVNASPSTHGSDRLREIRKAISCPLVVSCDLLPDAIDELTVGGVYVLAIPSTAFKTEDMEHSIRQLIERLRQ